MVVQKVIMTALELLGFMITLFLGVGVLVFLFLTLADREAEKQTIISAKQLLAVRSELSLGMGAGEARKRIVRAQGPDVYFREYSNDIWSVQTRGNFTATNWDLWLQFCDGALCGIYVRIADGIGYSPPDGPPDIVSESAKELSYSLGDSLSVPR